MKVSHLNNSKHSQQGCKESNQSSDYSQQNNATIGRLLGKDISMQATRFCSITFLTDLINLRKLREQVIVVMGELGSESVCLYYLPRRIVDSEVVSLLLC